MSDLFTSARAMLRAVFADTLTASPDRRALKSIDKLDAVLEHRNSAPLSNEMKRIARDL